LLTHCGITRSRGLDKGQFDANFYGTIALGPLGRSRSLLVVDQCAKLCSGRTEDRDPIALAPGRPKSGQIVDDFPKSAYGPRQDLFYGFFVCQTD
jgi:hypothetical protein